jgi:hypothetical protein
MLYFIQYFNVILYFYKVFFLTITIKIVPIEQLIAVAKLPHFSCSFLCTLDVYD